ncbi:multiple C2 and transmembrane domain-containing protein isoform X2 [Microplitis mediator]|uniref:multiple C2 and transmembrane domain-containing protein isoform X2 n=1 Tax=Microplitis mediator TaxID=375433 RepID=UPI002556E5CB|nr:multiple C2 and transmembrane domain-containing protein isoform X2 [Microplitis mediator]XP_057330179.1 multiple C2 and transmembrane domain-containing protein isoform X2 [Microplitis mediator]
MENEGPSYERSNDKERNDKAECNDYLLSSDEITKGDGDKIEAFKFKVSGEDKTLEKNNDGEEKQEVGEEEGEEEEVNKKLKLSRIKNLGKRRYFTMDEMQKHKKTVQAFKQSVEKRVESVEKIFEDKVEKMLEEKMDKHPWLQPIETWIVDKCKKDGRKDRLALIPRDQDEGESEGGSEGRERLVGEFEGNYKGGEFDVEFKNSLENGEVIKIISTPVPVIDINDKHNSESKHAGHDFIDRLKEGWKEKVDDVTRYFQRTNRLADVNRRLKSQIWSSVVTIVLVEAKSLLPMDIDGLSDPYVKFRLGTEKYKSKVVNKTINPVWLEQFDLHLYEDPYLGQELEVTVWDRDKGHQDDLMGRTTIDLAGMERETTHRIWKELEDGAGSIFLLLTISGTTASETISDLAAHEETPRERDRISDKYSLWNSLQRPRDVGHLTIKVYKAQGLAAADLGGKSDPFCVLELVNSRLQTQTEYKTLAPNWQKIFTFNVKDINSVLEVTVYDEDRDHKVEFLGKIAIPLLKIRNGEKRWYALKDKKLRCRAKGNFPQILLEMRVIWNVVRACIRTLNPKEKKYMEPEVKFKRQVFLRNVLRLKAIIMYFIDLGKYIQSCWEWESKTRSIVALVLFVLGCYYFEPYMIPVAALLIMLKYCLVSLITNNSSSSSSFQIHSSSHDQDFNSDDGPPTPGDDDDDEDDKDKEEKKSLKERLQAIQEVTQTVQNSIGYIASLCERVKNLFNFTVPYLSYLAMILSVLGSIVLYLVPMRYLILAWGVNKFFRKILRPHSVPNNEVLDLISRLPDDEDLLSYRELKPMPTADCEKGSTSSPNSNATSRREQRKRHNKAA